MASPPTPPPPPVGEDSWSDFIDQQSRTANSLEERIGIVEFYRSAVNAEVGSIRLWIAYCEYFWSLHQISHSAACPWPAEERAAAREIFTLDTALHLWNEGHDATKYRLNDSHLLWNRWIALERDLLGKTRTPEGVRRITHLYRDRLLVPQAAWDETSQTFSTFLSEYNTAEYEDIMRVTTERAALAKRLYDAREHMEARLRAATDPDSLKAAMRDYVQWEIANTNKERKNQATAIRLTLGLFSRALTGTFASDEAMWTDFAVFVSHYRSIFSDGKTKNDERLRLLPNSLDILQRAVQHCPWSGALWSRYILSGEEAGLAFADMERIKHAATNSSQLDREGMTAVVDMYAAWCGYLKRTAMHSGAPDEAVDIADSGLVAALEAVQVWGERRFGDKYEGDPKFRLERILIQYLTEKHEAIDEAREQWNKLAERRLYANSYDFWLTYFMWEMLVSEAQKSQHRSPTPGATGLKVPSLATEVLERAIRNRRLDWPERVMEVYLHHCNDYETSDTLRRALNTVHKVKQGVLKRREQEAAAAYAAQLQEQQARVEASAQDTEASPTASKRKREASPDDNTEGNGSKRARNDVAAGDGGSEEQQAEKSKRDRENTSIFVTELPPDVTATKVKSYFKEFGHINNLQVQKEQDGKSSVAFIEFRDADSVPSALIRDGKYFGTTVIRIRAAVNLTVFVTNFPPTADEAYIRNLFNDCGEIFTVRWPSLKYNTHRRFCYVTFRDLIASAKAVKLDGELLDGRYKLSAMYSDPSLKKSREGATAEGREVHVKNLDTEVDEDTLRAVFVKYGEVDRVRILRSIGGKSRGSAFVVYAKKEDAEKAVLELDGTKLRSQIMTVEMSVQSNYKPSARTTGSAASPSPTPGEDVSLRPAEHHGQRTFALLGVPDTVNIARIRALVEPHGTIVKLLLRADHGGVIVELLDVAAVGKAQLALEGTEIDGHKLRVGTPADLFKDKSGKKVDHVSKGPAKATAAAFMPPPPRVKRPVLQSSGGKRGLGYVGPKAPVVAANGEAKTNGPTAAPKSNADFRKLFLKEGSSKSDNKEDRGSDAKDVDASQNGH